MSSSSRGMRGFRIRTTLLLLLPLYLLPVGGLLVLARRHWLIVSLAVGILGGLEAWFIGNSRGLGFAVCFAVVALQFLLFFGTSNPVVALAVGVACSAAVVIYLLHKTYVNLGN